MSTVTVDAFEDGINPEMPGHKFSGHAMITPMARQSVAIGIFSLDRTPVGIRIIGISLDVILWTF